MKYLYVDYLDNAHFIKKNKALAKLQRDAVICRKVDNIIIISDCASPYANRMLSE